MQPERRPSSREPAIPAETVAPLFPLPNVLLYPDANLPIHVFEPRYVQLVEDMQAIGEDTIVFALLRPGREALDDYFESPPIHPIAGLGKVTQCGACGDDRYNILVQGLARVEIVEELEVETPYRRARVRTLTEPPIADSTIEEELRLELMNGLIDFANGSLLIPASARVSYLADVLTIAMPISMEEKAEMFSQLDQETRARAVLDRLRGDANRRRSFENLDDDQGDRAPWN